jgi:hypothetical protein
LIPAARSIASRSSRENACVFVAALIAVEKLEPWKSLANRGIAVLLLALGLAVALVPEDVPCLTVPDAARGMNGGSMHHMMAR